MNSITIELNEKQKQALSQVLKRLSITDTKRLSENENEAYTALEALETIRQELAKEGYKPR